MRDQNRIPKHVALLTQIWSRYPDLRLGQLLVNAVTDESMLYNMEDCILLDKLQEFDAKHCTAIDDYKGRPVQTHTFVTATCEHDQHSICTPGGPGYGAAGDDSHCPYCPSRCACICHSLGATNEHPVDATVAIMARHKRLTEFFKNGRAK